jgi:hypothetical protein
MRAAPEGRQIARDERSGKPLIVSGVSGQKRDCRMRLLPLVALQRVAQSYPRLCHRLVSAPPKAQALNS